MKFRVQHAGGQVQTLPLWSQAVKLASALAPKHGVIDVLSVVSPDDGGPEVCEHICTVRIDNSQHRKARNGTEGEGKLVLSFK